jgi:hypothetical protein
MKLSGSESTFIEFEKEDFSILNGSTKSTAIRLKKIEIYQLLDKRIKKYTY